MAPIDYNDLAKGVCDGLRSAFSNLIAANTDQTFYTFAIWTDDSLQFANPCANTEEGLESTVERYRREVDPEYNTTSTPNGMRWSYGDWKFFPIDDEDYLSDVNSALSDNFNADEEIFEQQIEPLWQALPDGFKQLNDEGFFGVDDERTKITLLVVGDLPSEIADHCATVLNPKDTADKYINWNYG